MKTVCTCPNGHRFRVDRAALGKSATCPIADCYATFVLRDTSADDLVLDVLSDSIPAALKLPDDPALPGVRTTQPQPRELESRGSFNPRKRPYPIRVWLFAFSAVAILALGVYVVDTVRMAKAARPLADKIALDEKTRLEEQEAFRRSDEARRAAEHAAETSADTGKRVEQVRKDLNKSVAWDAKVAWWRETLRGNPRDPVFIIVGGSVAEGRVSLTINGGDPLIYVWNGANWVDGHFNGTDWVPR